MRLRVCICILALWAAPVWSQFELKVGRDAVSWLEAQDSLAFVNMVPDSLWTWKVEPGENLLTNVLGRGGRILVSYLQPSFDAFGDPILVWSFRDDITAVENIADGDPSTAFDPDDFGLSRQAAIYIDLGGAYTIERTRVFPRLDDEHVGNFPQNFDLGLSNQLRAAGGDRFLLEEVDFQRYLFFGITRPNLRAIIEWPGVLQVPNRQARYVRFQPIGDAPWELAELELYTDGTSPAGFYRSVPLLAGTGTPVWGRVRHEGGAPVDDLPIVIQTRTGPDEDPLIYFITQGPSEIQVNRAVWEYAADPALGIAQGPVRPNPEWSGWETIEGGVVRSPSPSRFLQFRVKFLQPGVKLEQLVFEYSSPPASGEMRAEISPAIVDAGAETALVMTMQTRRLEGRSDTGFRFVEVLTSARIEGIDSVKVDDAHVLHTARIDPARGFEVNFWRRVVKDGSFVQIFFRGKIFADGTRFEVRTVERRRTAAGAEPDTVIQYAREADVDLELPSAGLTVRLSTPNAPLVADVETVRRVLTPNGDGVNDVFEVAYSLLKLTQPAPVFFAIYDLRGRLVRRGYAGEDQSGRFARVWDGRDDWGALVSPGLYLYQVQVEADAETQSRTGVVNVAY